MRTFGRLRRDHDGWIVESLEPHVAMRFKHLFPRIQKTAAPPYRLPADLSTAADLDWFLSRYPLAADQDDLDQLRDGRLRYEVDLNVMTRILAEDYAPPPYAGLLQGREIRRYQAQAVEILRRSKGLLLGDEVGLGKTITAIGAMLQRDALPAIVVAQAHLQKQWCEVIRAFTNLRVHPIRNTKPARLPPADVYVFRYTQLMGWSDWLATLGQKLVVFDEIQELRTGDKAGKGQAAFRLAAPASMRLGLSATPIYNYGQEIWSVMQYVRPEVLGPREDFMREWCGGGGRLEDPQALGTYLREQHAFIRRTKRDVGQEMPAVNRIIDIVECDDTVHSIEERAHRLALKVTTGEFVQRGQAARELDMLVRYQTGVAKAKAVAQFVRIIVEGGEPVLLVGWHRDVYDIWLKELEGLDPVLYTGSETAAAKDEAKRKFTSGEAKILIMSLRSGAGLDGLQQHCSTVVFGELDWSPGVHHQVIGRLDREGQTQPVTAIFLVTEEGSDPPMMEVLGIKASEASRIVDPSLGVQAVQSDYGHVQRLVNRYLDRRRAA